MIAFVDNDVITKLAACDLLDAALAALQLTMDDVSVLPTAPFSLHVRKNRDKGEKRFGLKVHQRICRFVEEAKTASETPNARDMEILSAVEGIDAGEAVLLALCARTPASILATGDKRAIRALGSASGLDDIRCALTGRVYCLEHIVRLAIDHLGFATALAPLLEGCAEDTVLRSVFGSGLRTTEANAREGLRYYEAELRTGAAGLLRET